MENTEDSGLVIYPKTVRSEVEEALLRIAQQMNAGHNESEKEEGHFVVLTPGSVRVKRRGITPSKQPQNARDRQAIKGWSKKSRANMVARFSSLDLSPLASAGDSALAVMITLTYPRDWEILIPTASDAKSHLQQFRKRFERRFGRPFFAMWKAEFQRRGAVHFHLFTASPLPLVEFRQWVANTWTDVVKPTPEEERIKHLQAGTAVDVAVGATVGDARLVAVYFSKHSSANFGVKEYQNTPPEKWIEAGSVGRFWGYWHFKPVEVQIRISRSEAVNLARVLRRWFRAKGFTRVQRVARVDSQGTIRFRRVRRRNKRMSRSFGFLAVEDSLALSSDLNRFLRLMRDAENGHDSA